MPVVKHREAEHLARSALVLDLSDLGRQAEAIIARARAEADSIMARAQAEAQELVDTADARGYEAGLERGLAEGSERGRAEGHAESVAAGTEAIGAIAEGWGASIERWSSQCAELLACAREDVLRFAFALGRKIVMRTPEVDPTVVQDQLRESIALLGRATIVSIAVNPDDLALVEEVLPALLERADANERASIEPDDRVARGGCIVRTAEGGIDATLETQLDRAAAAILGVPEAGSAGAEA